MRQVFLRTLLRRRTRPLSVDVLLRRLERLHPKSIDLSLGRVRRLLDRLGDPQDRLPPVVHVAGTNGKGSVIAFLRALLEAQGRRVHTYTSPHLVRFNERIVLAGTEISDPLLVSLLEECEDANGDAPITFFEITTAAAFLAFARTDADVLLLETGLGGRLDATNLVAQPALTILTPISLDHQHFLGSTVSAIAREKAGILKRAVPCVTARQDPQALRIIADTASALGAPLAREGVDWWAKADGEGFVFESRARRCRLPAPGLKGAFQIGNAGLALAACGTGDEGAWAPSIDDAAAFEIVARGDWDPQHVSDAIRDARWPGRLQRLGSGRLRDQLPGSWEVWLDGGHNPAGARVLAEHAREWRDRPLILVTGMMQGKDAAGFLSPFVGVADPVLAVPIPDVANAMPAAELAEIAQGLGWRALPCRDVATALMAARRLTDHDARVMICGSLYLIGSVLSRNDRPESGMA